MALDNFFKNNHINDAYIPSYNKDTIQAINQIINGNIDDYVDSKNGTVLLYIGLYKRYVENDIISGEKYYLLAAEYHNLHAIFNLANLYTEQNKLMLAEKYFLMIVNENYSHAEAAMRQLGCIYDCQGKSILAIQYYAKAEST